MQHNKGGKRTGLELSPIPPLTWNWPCSLQKPQSLHFISKPKSILLLLRWVLNSEARKPVLGSLLRQTPGLKLDTKERIMHLTLVFLGGH